VRVSAGFPNPARLLLSAGPSHNSASVRLSESHWRKQVIWNPDTMDKNDHIRI
jgi:hypothetical protein